MESDENRYAKFALWLDSVLENELPKETAAINFNLYDDGNCHWSMELICAASFDRENDDWACDELLSTRESPFSWQEDCTFESAQDFAEALVRRYISEGKKKDVLLQWSAVGVGFVDGDISLVYEKHRS